MPEPTADLDAESAFWAGMLGGQVFEGDRFHSVIDAGGEWCIGVQLAPNHVRPEWPDGTPQQVHLDLHVQHVRSAQEDAVRFGATLLQAAPDLDSEVGHQVYADPAGTPVLHRVGAPVTSGVG
jgi:Glyoxalase-like domain